MKSRTSCLGAFDAEVDAAAVGVEEGVGGMVAGSSISRLRFACRFVTRVLVLTYSETPVVVNELQQKLCDCRCCQVSSRKMRSRCVGARLKSLEIASMIPTVFCRKSI